MFVSTSFAQDSLQDSLKECLDHCTAAAKQFGEENNTMSLPEGEVVSQATPVASATVPFYAWTAFIETRKT